MMRRHIAGFAGTALGLARPPLAGGAGGASCCHLQQHLLAASSRSLSTTALLPAGITAARAPLRWAVGASAALRAFHTRAATSLAAADPNAPTPNAQMQDDFLSASSVVYLEGMEDKFREDPNSVPASWAAFLRQMGAWDQSKRRNCPPSSLPVQIPPRSLLHRDGHDLTPTPPKPLLLNCGFKRRYFPRRGRVFFCYFPPSTSHPRFLPPPHPTNEQTRACPAPSCRRCTPPPSPAPRPW
jgi:hypothetical protein